MRHIFGQLFFCTVEFTLTLTHYYYNRARAECVARWMFNGSDKGHIEGLVQGRFVGCMNEEQNKKQSYDEKNKYVIAFYVIYLH